MARVIKFRGLRTDGKGWVYGLIVKRKSKYFIEVEFTDLENEVIYRAYEVIPESIGQYTGLKDKNSVEIYEGDRLSAIQRQKQVTVNGVIEMPKSCWVLTFITENGNERYYRTAQFSQLEIIGNIHEKEVTNG